MESRWRAALLLAGILAVGTLVALDADARMNGVSGRAVGGCTCHGNGTPWNGVGGQLPIIPALEGVPEAYEPGKTYPLTASVTGGLPYLNAGFDLNATAGRLTVPAEETNVQITTSDTFGGVAGEATHKTPASRSWRVDWTAPREGTGPVGFFLAVNSVNGNSQPEAADQWNLITLSSTETNLPPVAPRLQPASGAGLGAVNVSWDRPTVADLTEIQVHGSPEAGFTPGSATLLATVAPGATGIRLENLTVGAALNLRLRVVDQGGLTADSNEEAVIVPAPEPVAEAPVQKDKWLPAPAMPLLVALLAAAVLVVRRRSP